jgi:S-adenosyl-L-methionine hydrolase (adenosine-forming)
VEKPPIITLTTDFGTADGYVGIVKGVILGICENATIIDVSHDIPPWNISAAAWVLANSHSYFPKRSVHVAVVDPGVGSKRRPILVEAKDQVFIGPDNGIFSAILQDQSDAKVFELTESKYWMPEVSHSFHARDLFAPVAAHFASGITSDKLGQAVELDSIVKLPSRELKINPKRVEGSVSYVDRFGNLITNIKKDNVRNAALCQVGKRSIGRIGQSYSGADQGAPIAFIGSHGYLEIAVSQGRADEKLDAGVNTPVILFESAQ